MKKTAKVFSIAVLMGLLMLTDIVPTAQAANLQARSATIDPATGYPTWYQDANNLSLTLCLDQNGLCILPGAFTPPATKAGINAANFPVEAFYYMVDTAGDSPGGTISLVLYEAALESGFAAAVVDGGQAVFTRIRIRANVTLPGTYTVTHPFGVETFVVSAIVPGPEINFTEDVPGLVAGAFDGALTSRVGPFLTNAAGTFVTDPVTGNRYLGSVGAPVAVTGSPTGVNSLTITGPTADTLSLNTFSLMGKVIGMDVAPSSNVDLGPILMLNPTAPQTVTVTNTTGNPITFGPLAPAQTAGTDFADFAILPPAAPAVDCFNATLTAAAPGNTCSFNVTFTPATAAKGIRTATVPLAPTTVQPAPPAPAVPDPPAVTLNLSGTALVTVAATAGANGTITPVLAAGLPAGTAPAGTAITFTVTPTNSKFKVRDVLDGTTPLAGPAFTLNTADVNHTVTASFMPSGNLTGSGTLGVADAVKALRISLGLVTPTAEDLLAMDVAPLGADGRPAGDQGQDLRDVLLILRRALGVVTW